MLVAVSACAAGTRSTRALGEQEYVAFADRPNGGFAPMAPPDCAAGAEECRGQWLAPVHIGERGGSIERVLQTQTGFTVYVRESGDQGDAPNWTLLLREPVVPVTIVKLPTQEPGATGRSRGDGTM